MCLYSHSTQYSSRYKCNTKNSFNSEAHALNTISQQLHHMEGACCLHDTGVQKLTLNMLCPFLTSPGEGRPQHNITLFFVHSIKSKVKASSLCLFVAMLNVNIYGANYVHRFSLLKFATTVLRALFNNLTATTYNRMNGACLTHMR